MKLTPRLMTLLTATILVSPALHSAEIVSPDRLPAMANTARTPSEHAIAAEKYRQRSAELEAEAVQDDIRADHIAHSMGGMYYKWPAMAPKSYQQARESAIEEHRAAYNNALAAEKQLRLSVETMANAE